MCQRKPPHQGAPCVNFPLTYVYGIFMIFHHSITLTRSDYLDATALSSLNGGKFSLTNTHSLMLYSSRFSFPHRNRDLIYEVHSSVTTKHTTIASGTTSRVTGRAATSRPITTVSSTILLRLRLREEEWLQCCV